MSSRAIDALIAEIDRGSSAARALPAACYRDADFFAVELERVLRHAGRPYVHPPSQPNR